jgi:H+/Cl- antiporter ClcA
MTTGASLSDLLFLAMTAIVPGIVAILVFWLLYLFWHSCVDDRRPR